MATPELRELRHRYKEAYTRYMSSVQAVSDASQSGEWPTDETLKAEVAAFDDLSKARELLFRALFAHSKIKAKGLTVDQEMSNPSEVR